MRIHMVQGYLQHVLNPDIICLEKERFDFVIMLNTYRGGQYAYLRQDEEMLPSLADDFFYKHARYTFVTASAGQILRLMKKGFDVKILGRGESPAIMIVITSMHNLRMSNIVKNVLYILFVQSIYYLPKEFVYYCRIIRNKLLKMLEK